MPNVTGVDSGFKPVSLTNTTSPVFTVMVNDTNPIWLYCAQVGHCPAGMAMVINEMAGSNMTLAAYKAAAAKLTSTSTSTTSKTSVVMATGTVKVNATAMMNATGIATFKPSAAPMTFTGSATREVFGSSIWVGLLLIGLSVSL